MTSPFPGGSDTLSPGFYSKQIFPMALSLQEQLLQAGLTDKKKVKQAKKEKHQKVKLQQRHKVVETDENKIAAEKAQAEKRERDRLLNLETKKTAEKKAIAAQVKQLIELNKQPKGRGDLVCNFTHGTLIKRLHVDQLTQKRISQGKFAIVTLAGGYEIVPMQVADKISERDPDSVVYRADAIEQAESASDDDDWYADYQIPDDLTW